MADVRTAVSFGVALCEAMGLNPNDVLSLDLHFRGMEITVEVSIHPSQEEIEKAQEIIPILKQYRLEKVEDDG